MNKELLARIKERDESLINTEDMPEEVIKNFRSNVVKFNEVDKYITMLNNQISPIKDQLKPLNEQIKILKSQKGLLEQEIVKFMKNNSVSFCNLPGKSIGDTKGAISFTTTSRKIPVTLDYVKKALVKFFKDEFNEEFLTLDHEEKADLLYNYIYVDKPVVKKDAVKKVAYVQTTDEITRVLDEESS